MKIRKPSNQQKLKIQQIQHELSKGILLVASVSAAYYKAAIRLAISIKDHYPDARIILFTHETFVRDKDRYLFEEIRTGIPVHSRAKLWALDKTPFDLTLYMDCDTEVWHEDISNIFDLIGDNDIMITKIREYAGKIVKITDNDAMIYHCGLFLYRKTDRVMSFMSKWWTDYDYQIKAKPWPWPHYNEKMKPWDQFTFWRLLKEEYTDIKIDVLPDDARWNFIHLYLDSETDKPIVIWHYTLSREAIHADAFEHPSGATIDFR